MGGIPVPVWVFLFLSVILGVGHSAVVTTTLNPGAIADDEAFIITTISPPVAIEIAEDSADQVVTVGPSSNDDLEDPPTENPGQVQIETKTPKRKETTKPEIRSFQIHSNIRYRYCRTYVTSRMANPNHEKSQEVSFRVVLPETAFISKFVMEIDGKSYEAYVKEKEEAKNIYAQAQSQGQSAGLVELNTRNSNVFNVNVNIKAQSKVNFNLTYEELLTRRLGRYEQSINISPEQLSNVKDFQVTATIEESQNITLLRVPQLRNDLDAQQDAEGNVKDVVIKREGNKANITWKPSEKEQAALAAQGQTGRLIIEYDLARELDAGQVLVMNGYFVHFFSPANLAPLRKHVVFILDISGSMWGRKMEQLKEAMHKILGDLNTDDFFNIITFSSDVNLWGPGDKIAQGGGHSWSPPAFFGENPAAKILNDASKRQPFPASQENVKKAQEYINSLVATGGTNIHDAIVQALNLTREIKNAREAHLKGETPQVTSTTTSTTPAVTTTTTVGTTTTTTASTTTSTSSSSPASTTTAKTSQEQVQKPVTILPEGVEPLIIFLTDGEPTVGITNPLQIQGLIQLANKNISIPIFSLAFGEGADFPFVKKLSLQNNGFARKIYEASDATIQLTGFYNEIASPLLSNVTFNYTSPDYEVANLTTTKFATIFGGTEIAVSGVLVPKPGNETANATTTSTTSTTTESIPDTTTASSVAPKTDSQVELRPTKEIVLDVLVGGMGRNGIVAFDNPEIFSSPIPWGVPVIRPWPPRPTPPPTVEDTFLEKLWAYLTIKQLIDQDLAAIHENEIPTTDDSNDQLLGSAEVTSASPVTSTTPNVASLSILPNGTISRNVTVVKETPRQRALRLALKYGFVTPLTSLVVVKPNETDVANAVPSDSKPDVVDSMSDTSLTNYAIALKRAPHPLKIVATSNRISGSNYALLPLSLQSQSAPHHRPAHVSFVNAHPGPPAPFLPAFAQYPQAIGHLVPPGPPGSFNVQQQIAPTPHIRPGAAVFSTTVRPFTTVRTTEKIPVESVEEIPTRTNLTLKSIKWLKGSENELKLNETNIFRIATNESVSDVSYFPQGYSCQIRTDVQGTCEHLRDCVQEAFVNDFELYKSNYFCKIESTGGASGVTSLPYAGVCCPTNDDIDATTTIP